MMPWGKRAVVAGAVLAGAALLAAGALAIDRGHPAVGIALVVATCVAAALAAQTYWVRWDLSGASLRAGRADVAQVALTFDDGPGPDTPAVLDALERAGARATFFVLGRAALERPDLVREVARRGHLVALHGFSHRKLHLASPRTVAEELDRGIEAIRRAGVEPAPFFRAPHGFKGPVLGRALRRRRLRLVGWTRGVWDTERPGAAAIADRACGAMRGGEILLLHDGCGTPGIDPRRDQTAEAVPEIARRWRDAGYELVSVDRLQTGAAPGSRAQALRWAGLAVVVVLAVVAARRIDPRQLAEAFSRASVPLLLAAAGANLLALAMQTGRWLAIVHPVVPSARARDGFFALVAGYAIGLVVPARASDVARAHIMARRTDASMATLTATAFIDHLLGSVALFAALGLLAAAAPVPVWLRSAGTGAFALAAAALVALWLIRPRGDAPPPDVHRKGLRGIVARLREGVVAVGRPRALAISWLFAFGGWASEVLIAWLSLEAFGLPGTVEMSLLVVLATTLSAAASVSPGNAGAFELACVLALASFGVPEEAALAFAVGYHAVHLVPVALLGGGWLLATGYKSGVVEDVP
jgi:peptidoglycan-N-acetylglucosamine deacetylase